MYLKQKNINIKYSLVLMRCMVASRLRLRHLFQFTPVYFAAVVAPQFDVNILSQKSMLNYSVYPVLLFYIVA